MDTPHHQRLDRLMEDRRLDLDMAWDDVALTAKISVATLRAIRRGETDPRPITKRRIESALQWAPGSFDAILADRSPTPIEQMPPDRFEEGIAMANAVVDAMEQDPELRERVRKILSAGSGQAPEVNNPDTEGDTGDEVAG